MLRRLRVEDVAIPTGRSTLCARPGVCAAGSPGRWPGCRWRWWSGTPALVSYAGEPAGFAPRLPCLTGGPGARRADWADEQARHP
jgi:hypothetical protein